MRFEIMRYGGLVLMTICISVLAKSLGWDWWQYMALYGALAGCALWAIGSARTLR